MARRILMLAAPGVGLLHGTQYARDHRSLLSDRQANGEAFPGEFIVRVPMRAWRESHVNPLRIVSIARAAEVANALIGPELDNHVTRVYLGYRSRWAMRRGACR